jgi:hypothetical protein
MGKTYDFVTISKKDGIKMLWMIEIGDQTSLKNLESNGPITRVSDTAWCPAEIVLDLR